jgi:hypothetical protein
MTSDAVNQDKRVKGDEGRQLSPEQAAAAAMVAEARQRGLELTGPDGLLKLFTKNVLEAALNEEITEHLRYEKNGAEPGRVPGNVRNGSRAKTVVSDAVGEVRIDVPRDREGTFEPQIVKKRQRRLTGVDEIVLSLYAKGLTTGEIPAHFAEIYGASISRETVSRITEKVAGEMAEWASRPLDAVYVAVFIDAIVVRVRDDPVAEPLQAHLPLADDLRLERAVPVPRNRQVHRPDIGQHRLRSAAVAAVPAAAAGWVVLLISQVPGHLLSQRPLQHRLGHLRQQAVRAEQLHALSLRPAQQLIRQLRADQLPCAAGG